MNKIIKKIIILVCCCLQMGNVAKIFAQEYIYISRSGIRDVFRVNAAYTNLAINLNDTSKKAAQGVHLLNEAKILSALWKNDRAFSVHDAFYFDINFGKLNQEPRLAVNGGIKDESKFAIATNFGYLCLFGFRNKKWGALVGLDFRWNRTSVGSYSSPELNGNLFNYTRPFVLRAEYCLSKDIADQRVMAMLWIDNGSATRAKYINFRVEYPLGKSGRWWLFGQFINIKTTANDLYLNSPTVSSVITQFNIGFRVQNALL